MVFKKNLSQGHMPIWKLQTQVMANKMVRNQVNNCK
jgi:hypothetical protein